MTTQHELVDTKPKGLEDKGETPGPVSLGWRRMILGLAILVGATILCLIFVRFALF